MATEGNDGTMEGASNSPVSSGSPFGSCCLCDLLGGDKARGSKRLSTSPGTRFGSAAFHGGEAARTHLARDRTRRHGRRRYQCDDRTFICCPLPKPRLYENNKDGGRSGGVYPRLSLPSCGNLVFPNKLLVVDSEYVNGWFSSVKFKSTVQTRKEILMVRKKSGLVLGCVLAALIVVALGGCATSQSGERSGKQD
jgi:hypothetical protein